MANIDPTKFVYRRLVYFMYNVVYVSRIPDLQQTANSIRFHLGVVASHASETQDVHLPVWDTHWYTDITL